MAASAGPVLADGALAGADDVVVGLLDPLGFGLGASEVGGLVGGTAGPQAETVRSEARAREATLGRRPRWRWVRWDMGRIVARRSR